jgi:hypothetical protein
VSWNLDQHRCAWCMSRTAFVIGSSTSAVLGSHSVAKWHSLSESLRASRGLSRKGVLYCSERNLTHRFSLWSC